jgi:uncharacterized protein
MQNQGTIRFFFIRLPAFLAVAITLFILPAPLMAASASHQKATEELLLLINMPGQLQLMANQTLNPMRIRLSQMKTTQEKADVMRKHIKRYELLVQDNFGWEKNKQDYIDLYANTYSEYEIKTLITFFKSAAGKKFLSPGADFQRSLANIAQSRAAALKPALDEVNANLQKELTALNAAQTAGDQKK